jgi:LuxR family maltose regulon positive regulatory protein
VLTDKHEQANSILNRKEKTGTNHSFETYFYEVARARYYIAQSMYEESLRVLGKLRSGLKIRGALELLAEVELLTAKAYLLRNEREEAMDAVLTALACTHEEHFIRTYINEGEEIKTLLTEIRQRKKVTSSDRLNAVPGEYLDVLIRTFDKEGRNTGSISEDVLSSRELDTLKLIAEDLTNQEIANTLYISITTVKSHVRNVLLKLEAKNRSEAVSIARERQII